MDITYNLHDITFVWDEGKAKQNKLKHGVTFEESAEVFFDPFIKVLDASQNFEEREAIIGLNEKWELLFVVYAETLKEAIRIISACDATRQERLDYENG